MSPRFKSLLVLLALGATGHASVLLELAGGYLKSTTASAVPYGSGILVLVASTSDAEFTPITSSSSLVVGTAVASGSDDVVIYKGAIRGDGNGDGLETAGEFRRAVTLAYANGVAAGNPVRLYWFPTLTAASTRPGSSAPYGSYRAALASTDLTDADGSAPWVLPADGTSGHELLFVTADAGSTLNAAITGQTTGATEADGTNDAPGTETDPDDSTDGGGGTTNQAPVAADDTFTIITATSLNPLANDTDADGDTLTITAVTQPAKGTATLSATRVVYRPGSAFDGSDTFTYTISDGNGHTATATIHVSNPYLELKGTYRAVLTSNGAAAGQVVATLAAGGRVTGALIVGSARYALSGVAASDGTFTTTIRRTVAQGGNLTVTLTFAEDGSGHATLSANITGASATYAAAATAALATAPLATAPAGRYNILLPVGTATPVVTGSATPAGTGWAMLAMSRTASLTGVARLPDSTVVSLAGQLRVDGTASLSASVYRRPVGTFALELTFATATTSDVTGAYTLVKPTQTITTGYFASGFTLQGAVTGARYTGAPALTFTSSASPLATLAFSGGGLTSALSQTVSIASTGVGTAVAPVSLPVSLRIIPATGYFVGRFTPSGGTATVYTGVILKKGNAGTGLFLSNAQTGTATLTPQ